MGDRSSPDALAHAGQCLPSIQGQAPLAVAVAAPQQVASPASLGPLINRPQQGQAPPEGVRASSLPRTSQASQAAEPPSQQVQLPGLAPAQAPAQAPMHALPSPASSAAWPIGVQPPGAAAIAPPNAAATGMKPLPATNSSISTEATQANLEHVASHASAIGPQALWEQKATLPSPAAQVTAGADLLPSVAAVRANPSPSVAAVPASTPVTEQHIAHGGAIPTEPLPPRERRVVVPLPPEDDEMDSESEDDYEEAEEESDFEPLSDAGEEDDDEYTEEDIYRSKKEEREKQKREERIQRDREEAERVARENLRRSSRKRTREESDVDEEAEEAPRKRTRGKTKGRVEIVLEPIIVSEPAEVIEPRLAALRSSWQVLSMLHFFEHFRDPLELPEGATSLSIMEALASQRKSDLLLEVIDRALRHNRAYRRTNEWFRMIYNAHNRHLDHFPTGNPLDGVDEETFFTMDALQKALALFWICEWGMEESEILRNQLHTWRRDESMLRPLPIGYDREGNSFWRFGCNIESPLMFRECEHEPAEGTEAWSLQCKTASDWADLQDRLRESEQDDEKEFFSYISEELIGPVIDAEKRETHIQKRMKKWAMTEANILDQPRSRRAGSSRRYTFSEYDNL